MLTLGRYRGQRIIIVVPPSDKPTIITEMLVKAGRASQQTKLGYDAPANVQIDREEVFNAKLAAKAGKVES